MVEILFLVFLKFIDEGSYMVMLECFEIVNMLFYEFLFWEFEFLFKVLFELLLVFLEDKK